MRAGFSRAGGFHAMPSYASKGRFVSDSEGKQLSDRIAPSPGCSPRGDKPGKPDGIWVIMGLYGHMRSSGNKVKMRKMFGVPGTPEVLLSVEDTGFLEFRTHNHFLISP